MCVYLYRKMNSGSFSDVLEMTAERIKVLRLFFIFKSVLDSPAGIYVC